MTLIAGQLTIDGAEEERRIAPRGRAGLTAAQRAILRLLAERDITSSEAGQIVHLHRRPPCERCRWDRRCGYVATDGGDALRRLERRGLVRHSLLDACFGLWTLQR